MTINAVLTYRDKGTRRACGQTVGADGRGDYAVLFDSETVPEAEDAAYAYVKQLDEYERGRICDVKIIAGEYFSGNSIRIIKVKEKNHVHKSKV